MNETKFKGDFFIFLSFVFFYLVVCKKLITRLTIRPGFLGLVPAFRSENHMSYVPVFPILRPKTFFYVFLENTSF